MTDSLAHLIKNEQVGGETTATDFTPVVEQTPQEETSSTDQVSVIDSSTTNEVGVIMLSDWFETNNQNFTRVNRLKIQVQGVKPDSRLLCSVLDPKGGVDEDNHLIRNLELIKDANIFSVLDLPGYDMDVYGNGFQIMYSYGEDLVLKCYGIKTGLIIVCCVHINSQLLPYAQLKLKKKDTGINIPQPNREFINEKISSELDLEGLQIQYKQVQKELDQISDKQSAITWLLGKQTAIRDINHLLQIDDIIMWLIS
jgi:hypothetical protein